MYVSVDAALEQSVCNIYPPALGGSELSLPRLENVKNGASPNSPHVLCRPLAGEIQELSDGEHYLHPPEERLPSELPGGERHCHLHGLLPGEFSCAAWQHHLSAVHG